MFLLGSGRRLLGGAPTRLNCVKTRFQISTSPPPGVMVVDFAARPADAVGPLAGGAGRPEVLVLAHPLDPIGRQLDFVEPDVGRFVVVEIDRGREPLRIDSPSHFLLGQEFPGPVDRFALEIVAEAEVAQHLEERVVIGRAADVVDIARAEAFLAGRGPGEFELAAAEEVVLELVHARPGVKSTEGSQRGTSTSLGRRTQPLDSKKARYFSRSSSVFINWLMRLRKDARNSRLMIAVCLGTRSERMSWPLQRGGFPRNEAGSAEVESHERHE